MMTLLLVLLYQNSILGLQVNTGAISQSQKSSEPYFALHFLFLSIQSFDLYLSRSFYSFFIMYVAFLLRFFALAFFTFYVACNLWNPIFDTFTFHAACTVWIFFLLLHKRMRIAPCRILLLLFLHYT